MSEKPTAAWILSFIGGILGLIASLIYLIYLTVTIAAIGAATGVIAEHEMGPYMFGLAGTMAYAVCGWFIIANIIIIIGALKIRTGEPSSVRTGGILVLIFSILGGLNLLALIGGILALIWKPPRKTVETVPAPPPPPS